MRLCWNWRSTAKNEWIDYSPKRDQDRIINLNTSAENERSNNVKDFQYLLPHTIEEAVALKNEHDQAAVFMAGATDVVVRMRDHLLTPEYVIDLKAIPELGGITFSTEKGLFIGALATMNEIAADKNVLKYYPTLAKAAQSVGSKQVRNRATCIGNIVNASPLADTATPLYCYDAVVEIAGPEGKRELPITEFILFVRKVALQRGELVTGIRVPFKGAEGEFFKISRRDQVDLSTVCGTVLKIGGEYRIAMGSVAPQPRRLPKTEDLLRDADITPELIEQAAELAKTEVSPIDDVRADKQYRLDMVAYIVRTGLKKLA